MGMRREEAPRDDHAVSGLWVSLSVGAACSGLRLPRRFEHCTVAESGPSGPQGDEEADGGFNLTYLEPCHANTQPTFAWRPQRSHDRPFGRQGKLW